MREIMYISMLGPRPSAYEAPFFLCLAAQRTPRGMQSFDLPLTITSTMGQYASAPGCLQARIEALGGQILYWNGVRVMGVLAVSRAVGDHYLRPFVIPKPEVSVQT